MTHISVLGCYVLLLLTVLCRHAASAFDDAEFDAEFDADFDADYEKLEEQVYFAVEEDASLRVLLAEHARASNESLLWGPYRPNLYFGMRPRGVPDSFLSGLMWYNADTYNGIGKARHTCEQSDEMRGYGWTSFDARHGGVQVMHDEGNGMDIYTELAKDGENWGVRIRGVPMNTEVAPPNTAMVFYFGTQGLGRSVRLNRMSERGYTDDVAFGCEIAAVGEFELKVTRGPETNQGPAEQYHPFAIMHPGANTHTRAAVVDSPTMWRAKDYYMSLMQERVKQTQTMYDRAGMPDAATLFNVDDMPGEGNLHFVQRNFVGAFEFDILFDKSGNGDAMTSKKLTLLLEESQSKFDEQYMRVFGPKEPFEGQEYVELGKSLVSNLMGAIGYFHGTSLVDKSEAAYAEEDEEEFWVDKASAVGTEVGPTDLFASVPSRPFFPRGFYWDEGFHLLTIMRWDADLALEIIKSWFGTMDADGWIQREQILGDEARSKVPREFQVQMPTYANPPTLFLALSALVEKIEAQVMLEGVTTGEDAEELVLEAPAGLRATLRDLYPRLRRHYEWFRRTQAGALASWFNPDGEMPRPASWTEGFRWRGRTPSHCLTSGLDDYPRAREPHPAELHVDLLSWVGAMAQAMLRVGRFSGAASEKELVRYETTVQGVKGNLETVHWDASRQMYCDLAWDPETEDRVHECHEGYVSFLPFMVGLVPPEKVGGMVMALRDEGGVWSPYGVRSLSRRDAAFGQGENYWRGSIWVHMNYLVLQALARYAAGGELDAVTAATVAETRAALRANVVRNVQRQWALSGFAWEQYAEGDGTGKGVKHFEGFTALVAAMMAE
ncbi:glycoside hydrolase [Limtongia smithiae]|uniref:glycoside hydrolase n=1 Tax=Limtongia smithiae TaxID=1125753 RepID=UPI0034D00804